MGKLMSNYKLIIISMKEQINSYCKQFWPKYLKLHAIWHWQQVLGLLKSTSS